MNKICAVVVSIFFYYYFSLAFYFWCFSPGNLIVQKI